MDVNDMMWLFTGLFCGSLGTAIALGLLAGGGMRDE